MGLVKKGGGGLLRVTLDNGTSATFKGREQDLADAVASVALSDYASQRRWVKEDSCFRSLPYDEVRQGQQCRLLSIVTPMDNGLSSLVSVDVHNDEDENRVVVLNSFVDVLV